MNPKRISIVAALAVACSWGADSPAAEYRFVRVADTRDGNLLLSSAHHPAITSAGTVGFYATTSTSIHGYFRGNGGFVGDIINDTSPLLSDLAFEPGFSMNDGGEVAFLADKPAPDGFKIYRAGPGGVLTLIAGNGAGTFNGFVSQISINNSGNVGFTVSSSGSLDGLYVGNGSLNTRIYGGPGSGLSVGSGPSVNNFGTTSFSGGDGFGGLQFLKGAGESPAVIGSTGVNDLSSAAESVINDGGLVVFRATRFSSPTEGIFHGTGGSVLTTFADTDGPYSSLPNSGSYPALNNAGSIAFNASLDAGGTGIFIGPDPVTDRVIQSGSTLFGRTYVNNFGGTSREAINDAGEIAFQAQLLDGAGFSEVVVKAVPYVEQEWSHTGSGSWSDGGNWIGPVPDAYPHSANFLGAITAPAVVTSDAPHLVGSITFNNMNRYTVGGTGRITLDDSFAGRIDVLSGSHNIDAPLDARRNTVINIATGSELIISLPLLTRAITLTKEGGGNLEMRNFLVANLRLNAGTARVAIGNGNAGASTVEQLQIAGGTGAWAATFDIGDNKLVLNYAGASPIGIVFDQIKTAYNAGAWTGNGITSSRSTVALDPARRTAVGYAEATDVGLAGELFGGIGVDSTSIVMAYTLYGDADLSGSVDLDDFTRLAAAFGTASAWSSGDFNYDGVTNLDDFTALAANFGLTLPAAAPARGGADAAVPEPAMIAFALFPAILCRRHRRRC